MSDIWVDDRYCFACGEKNPIGMKLQFVLKDDFIETSFVFPKEFQGYKNTVHGGMISLLLDEVMVNLPWKKYQVPVVSAEINVKLRKPLEIGEKVLARAWFEKEKRKIFYVKGTVIKEKDSEVIAEATAICVKVEAKQIL
jgi:uncharacterized protein (TIGR00369 family)